MNATKLRGQSFGLMIMLAVQFILGMILNLLVTIPKTHPGMSGNYFSRAVHGFGWAITNGAGIVLLLHVIVAIALLLASLSLVVRAIAAKNQYWIIVSVIGALGVIVALTNGLAFIGYDSDVTSFVMAIGFITSAIAYSTGLAWAPLSSRQAETAGQQKTKQRRHHGRIAYTH